MLKWLVIGIGDITIKRVLPAILAEPRSRLVGLVTRDKAKALPYGVPGWIDLQAALRESGCDAVYVGTPVVLHAEQTIASLRAGKQVLCEKPTAMNYAEGCAMQQVQIRYLHLNPRHQGMHPLSRRPHAHKHLLGRWRRTRHITNFDTRLSENGGFHGKDSKIIIN